MIARTDQKKAKNQTDGGGRAGVLKHREASRLLTQNPEKAPKSKAPGTSEGTDTEGLSTGKFSESP